MHGIARDVQWIPAHPALIGAAVHAPVQVGRAVVDLERAALSARLLAAAYSALAAETAGQAAALVAAQAGDTAALMVTQTGQAAALMVTQTGQAAALMAARAGDAAAGLVVGAGLRAADLGIGVGGRLLAGAIPEGPGVVTEVPAPAPLPTSPALTDLYARVAGLAAGEVEVAPVLGADGVVRYLVLMRGMEPGVNPTVNTPGQAVRSSRLPSEAYSRAVLAALRRADVPRGAELMLVGHSQGGAAAMNVAAGRGYSVTHVVVAGSPIANKRTGAVRVLAVENQGDLVPDLDADEERANRSRTVYRFGDDRRLSRAAIHHGLRTGYLPELASARFSGHAGVRAYLDSAAPYLDGRPGAPRRFRLDAGPYEL